MKKTTISETKNKNKISVIVPVYNEEKYIEKCIRSLFVQTVKPLEIIVVDDGSTDNSRSKILDLRYKIKNLVLLKQKHQGPAIARNLGANHAKGDILVFVDADMYFDKNYLRNLIKPILKGQAVATFTKAEYVANPQNLWSQCWSINSYLPKSLHIDPNISNETTTFRAIIKKVFRKTEGYKSHGYTDDVTVLESSDIRAVPALGAVCYHYNPSTISEVFFSAKWMGKSLERTFKNFLIYSFFNSLRRGFLESLKDKNFQFILFKIVFDLGIIFGLGERIITGRHYK